MYAILPLADHDGRIRWCIAAAFFLYAVFVCFIERHTFVEELRIEIACAEVRIGKDLLMKRDRRFDTANAELVEGATHDLDRITARTTVCNDFCDKNRSTARS